MSWDAYLYDDRGHEEGWWNYTHNCNRMIAAALEAAGGGKTPPTEGVLGPVIGPGWWYRLNGATGPEGAAYLSQIIAGLEADPQRYRAMNPTNGWGDYDSLLGVLRQMRDRVPEWPTEWSASG